MFVTHVRYARCSFRTMFVSFLGYFCEEVLVEVKADYHESAQLSLLAALAVGGGDETVHQ